MKKSIPSPLEKHLGHWLRCLSNFVSHSFAERLAGQDISVAQWVVLRTLYDNDGITLNEAAGQVGVDKSSLSRMVERLVQKGLAIRGEGDDRRSVGLTLTAAGRTTRSFIRFPPRNVRNSQRQFKNYSWPIAGTYPRAAVTEWNS
jgi:hypothetical protein